MRMAMSRRKGLIETGALSDVDAINGETVCR
jgi:hypothetical protein